MQICLHKFACTNLPIQMYARAHVRSTMARFAWLVNFLTKYNPRAKKMLKHKIAGEKTQTGGAWMQKKLIKKKACTYLYCTYVCCTCVYCAYAHLHMNGAFLLRKNGTRAYMQNARVMLFYRFADLKRSKEANAIRVTRRNCKIKLLNHSRCEKKYLQTRGM